jgi:preprotein translocase subunit YajC
MNGLPRAVILQAGPPPAGDLGLLNLLPILAIFLIFYLLLIRPQSRRQREREKMIKALEKGDSVVTTGGIHGKVTGVTDDVLTLEIAALTGERVRIKLDRAQVERLLEKAGKGEGET